MILKASQRGGGRDLAVHLMRTDDNEHVSLHEIRGFASGTLKDAFKEAEAVSRGTKCRQYLFSVSLSPPEHANVPVSEFEQTIERIEERLRLDGQPRAIVFHEKDGRRHAHCFWSRIDAETMTARQLSFYKKKLMGISRELYLEHGWTMPRGLENTAERNPTNFTLAEWQQAKRQGIDPRWVKQAVQDCWTKSDNRRAFEQALHERGFFLARGDRRGHIVLDHSGEIYSLPRLLDVKTKEVRARLGDGTDLKSVEQTQKTIGERMSPAIRRHVAESRAEFAKRSEKINAAKEDMTKAHRQARRDLVQRQKTEWRTETLERASRLPKGLRGLWYRITGRYQDIRKQNEEDAQRTRARHTAERQAMIESQLYERRVLQAEFKELRHRQAEQLLELRKDVGRYFRFSRGIQAGSRNRDIGVGLRLER
ncbi:hypothetical protein GGE65_005442 [Skermanella aerolata]|uniref:relaxase/mobilization nuclease domain-containing protein n=1 Tax=Skermanella aerolata TaxID=393310 RepID=UPI003D192666